MVLTTSDNNHEFDYPDNILEVMVYFIATEEIISLSQCRSKDNDRNIKRSKVVVISTIKDINNGKSIGNNDAAKCHNINNNNYVDYNPSSDNDGCLS